MMAQPGWSLGEQDTVIDALARAVAAYPDKTVVDFSGDRFTYKQIDLMTTRFAHALAALGVSAGDTVVSMLDNNVDAIVTWLAVNKLCAVSVPLNTALRGGFLRHQISDAGANLAICEAGYLDRITAITGELPDLKTVLVRGGEEISDSASDSAGLCIKPLENHLGEDETPFEVTPRPADLAALIYTSGTTGPSKGCMLSFNYMCNLARQQLSAAPIQHEDILWTPLPLFHLNALSTGFISTILVGATISFASRFSVSGFWPAIEKSGATAISILGAMGNLLANADDNEAMLRCKGQIHTVRGNPFSEEMKNTWRTRYGAKQVGSNGYGLTEAAVVTTIAAGEYAAPGSSGKISPQFDMRIVDDEDVEVPVGQSGEIIIRPLQPNIMFQGYWQRPDATMKIMRNMWLHSGDIGRIDEDGFFYFVDRKKDYLRRRGENISSFELEQTFLEHPAIENVAIHAVPSEIIEDDVKLTAILKSGMKVNEKDLCLWAVERVPYFAVPRYIEFRKSFPTNPQGRVLKYQLRDEGVTETTWDIEKSDVKLTKN